jgi:hypothetical protein
MFHGENPSTANKDGRVLKGRAGQGRCHEKAMKRHERRSESRRPFVSSSVRDLFRNLAPSALHSSLLVRSSLTASAWGSQILGRNEARVVPRRRGSRQTASLTHAAGPEMKPLSSLVSPPTHLGWPLGRIRVRKEGKLDSWRVVAHSVSVTWAGRLSSTMSDQRPLTPRFLPPSVSQRIDELLQHRFIP